MMKKKNILFLAVLIVTVSFFSSCVRTRGLSQLYKEQSVQSRDVSYQRVAILPNRLPVTLQNPEKWREYNWNLIAKQFEKKGVRVVDYNSSVDLFESSGLPLEDTKSSRDKYAEIAERLNADLLIFPYYATNYYQTAGFLANTHHYVSIGSLQLYYAPENVFLARIDFEGDNANKVPSIVVTTGVPLFLGLISGAVGQSSSTATVAQAEADADAAQVLSILSGAAGIGFSLFSVIANAKKPETRWRTAFVKGIDEAYKVFDLSYPNGSSINNRSNSTPSSNVYGKYSLTELGDMKKKAVEAKDYKKAAEIKKEIDKRLNGN